MSVNNFIPVEDVLIRTEIAELSFACDLKKCKGACCTVESEYGAPLLEEEIAQIEGILDIVIEYLPKKHRQEIEDNGFYESKNDELLTASIDNKACVFVFFEKGIAKCSIEKAYFDGKIKFRKPISCHLFPLRISRDVPERVRYEQIRECLPAVSNGTAKNIPLYVFLKDALIRKFGKPWYEDFQTKCELENNAR